ncbi:MAG: AAA family ATPase, partial [Beijerinckiaceae bacterium]
MSTANKMENDVTSGAGNEPTDTGLAEVVEQRAKAAAKRQQHEQTGGNAGPAEPSEQRPGSNASQASGERADELGKPTPIRPEFENFPAELKSLPNWVLWRYLPPKSNNGKWPKVPFQPNRKPADTTNRSTWSTFDECRAAYPRGRFDGVGFVFDGEIGADGLCYCGVDLDSCFENGTIQSLARSRIKRLNTYTECSVSGTGFHCIVRAKPLDRVVKFDGVEVYTRARYFTFTGAAFGIRGAVEKIKAAPTEISKLVDEVRAKEAAAKQQQQSDRSGSDGQISRPKLSTSDVCDITKFAGSADNPEGFEGDLGLYSDAPLGSSWFATLSPELKDEVVDCALGVIAKNTRLLELEADGGNNAEYYKLTTSMARSGAPNAEDIFVKHASSAKHADPDETLRQHFFRCRDSQPSGNLEITVGTLLLLAYQNGANFDQWKRQVPTTAPLPPVPWSATELQVSFSAIPHRRWLYGVDLVRGEITVVGSPGGAGKTSLAIGMAISIAVGRSLLDEKIFGEDGLEALYINAEDSGIEMKRRTWAFCLKHNIAEQDLNRLYVAGTDDPHVQRLSFLQ